MACKCNYFFASLIKKYSLFMNENLYLCKVDSKIKNY